MNEFTSIFNDLDAMIQRYGLTVNYVEIKLELTPAFNQWFYGKMNGKIRDNLLPKSKLD